MVDELRTQQIELEQQNDQLKIAYDELGESNEELQNANDHLAEAHDRYVDLYDQAPVGYATLDERGIVLEANLRLASMLGVDRGDLTGRRLAKLVAGDDQDDFHLNLRRLLSDEEHQRSGLDLRLRRAQGGDLWTRTDWVIDQEKSSTRTIRVTVADITEYRNLQAQLAQADRMASVGLLAAGVAHEINNPLTYVLFNLESLAGDLERLRARRPDSGAAGTLDDLEDMADRARAAVEGTHRIRDIARHLRVFSHIDDGQLAPVALPEVFDTAIEMAFNEFKYRARLVKRYGDTPLFEANAGQLCQVFLNLLVNAAHAIDEGDVDGNEIRIRTWREGDSLMAEVEDTGRGIPPEHLDRVFEPFFTTKEVGVGSGLGLSICHKIITTHGGRITVASTVGRGTCFTIRFPARKEVADGSVAARRATSGQIAPGRVLVIDDEPMVSRAIAGILAGHEVVVANSGGEGQTRIEDDQPFDVILCDLMMPGFTGMDLHAWLSRAHPDLVDRVVFMTGGVFTPRAREFLSDAPNLCIEKPFDISNLRKMIRKLILAARAGSREPVS